MVDEQIIAIPMDSPPGGNMAVPQFTPQNKAELIDKIKPEAMVEIIRNRLLGKQWVNNEWVTVKSLKDRSLSEIGAWEISNLMLGVSSINISISKLTDREIKERAYRIARTAQYMMISNWKMYKLQSISQFYYVHEIVFSNTLAVLKQADKASIQELLKSTIHETRSISSNEKEPARHRLSRMLGLKD